MAARLGLGSSVAELLSLVGSELARNPALIGRAGQLAMSVARAGRHLAVDARARELLRTVRRAADRHPATFVLGGLVFGLALARLAKIAAASQEPSGVHVPHGRYTIVPAPDRRTRTWRQ